MDRDYPPTPRQVKATLVGLGALAVAGLLLFGGHIPGLGPGTGPTDLTTFDGRPYHATTFFVPVPVPGRPGGYPANLTFHQVSLTAWVSNWSIAGGTYLHGRGIEANGSAASFVFGGLRAQANWTDRFVAPGGAWAVVWNGGLEAELLVAA